MNGLNLFMGNKMELLALEFSKIIAEPLSSALSPEVVVVQSKGMERWLSMQIARHNSVCANVSFPFPDSFVQDIFSAFILNVKHPSFFKVSTMTFAIMKVLPFLIAEPGFENLKLYFGNKIENNKCFQMASSIAFIFEQYLVFRPGMVLKWERGDEDNWQAQLWRKIAEIGKGYIHRAQLQKTFLENIKNHNTKPADFPERVSVFGISYLPPFYMQVFSALSRLIPVYIFLMNPCAEYWGDIVSVGDIKKINRKYACSDHGSNLHLEKGNRLLASMGVLGRDFLSFILNMDCNVYELFEDNDSKGMLSYIQSDILHLTDRDSMAPEEVSETDTSVQIHSCHTPMREIEVLHDHILAFFEEIPELLPKDIIVMAPDIELYSPFIHAVFDSQTDRALRIPYSISDQSAGKKKPVIDIFMSILDLKDSRLGVTQVMDLLGSFLIRERFGLGASDIDIIQKWIKETNIKWGIDDKHRIKTGLPGSYENTWKAGIERMLSGYAMPGYGSKMFSGILPYDNIEGENAKILGKFLDFLYAVFDCMEQLEQCKSLSGWYDYFHHILDRFFVPDDMAAIEIKMLTDIFDGFLCDEKMSSFDEEIELEVIRSYFSSQLEKIRFGFGFLSSGVTFCSALPMRSIPFHIICLIGMNNEDFPGNNLRPAFDLIAKKPQPLDRSKRNDDKYLFLEAIVSVRKKLCISYVGQDIRDNTQRLPSVLVSELLDYIQKYFYIQNKCIGDHIINTHRLQAYSIDYFSLESGLSSYSKENFEACRAFYGQPGKKKVPVFISTHLPPMEKKEDITGSALLNIDMLSVFFSNPAKYILENRLEIFFKERSMSAEDIENFQIDSLDTYFIGSHLIENRLSGNDNAEFFSVYKAMGQLPHGSAGNVAYHKLNVDAGFFADTINRCRNDRTPGELQIDSDVLSIRLSGILDGIYDDMRIDFNYAKKKPKYVLNSWIKHLVFCALTGGKSFLVCKDSVLEFGYVENSIAVLKDLINIYKQGMEMPLCFFPESSFEYAHRRLVQNKSDQSALVFAQKRWIGNDYIKGESENPYYRLCFGQSSWHETPLSKEFKILAEKIFAPVFLHCKEQII